MKSSAQPLRQIADVTVLCLLCLLQFAFVFGMPWLDNGLWPQTEGPSAAIHLISAALAFVTGIQIAFKDVKYLKAARSPVVLALFTFAVLSAILAWFTADPIRSIQGTLKHGVGVLWHLELAIAVLAASALWQNYCFRRVMVWGSVVAAAGILVLYLIPGQPAGVPLAFPEWTGMVAFAAAGTLAASSREAARRERWISLALALIVFAVGYVVSENRAVLLAFIVVVGYSFIGQVPYLSTLVQSPFLRATTVVLLAITTTVAVYVSGPVIEARAVAAVGQGASSVASTAAVDRAQVQDGALGTVWSRSYMVRILVADMVDNPLTALVGNGFGHFSTAYEHHAREVPGRVFANGDAYPTASTTFWDVHSSANFHSHNMLAETVASVGVVGALVWLGIFAAMAYSSVGGAVIAMGFIVVGSFWFPVNHMLGPLAVVIAATVVPRQPGKLAETAISGFGPLCAILGATLFGYVGTASAILGVVERSERGFPSVEVNTNQNTCGFIRTRYFPEQEIVIDLYSILQNRIRNAENPAKELYDRTTNVISVNCMLRRYYERDGSIKALTASLLGRSSLISLGPISFGALKTEIVNWGDDLERLLTLVPERTEYLPPYITILGARAPEKALKEIDRFVPRLSDTDPVKFYLLSEKSKLTHDDLGYHTNFARALDLGFANLWPISEADVRAIRGN
jgi:hypothetical protein